VRVRITIGRIEHYILEHEKGSCQN
jgi:hypothetical protein